MAKDVLGPVTCLRGRHLSSVPASGKRALAASCKATLATAGRSHSRAFRVMKVRAFPAAGATKTMSSGRRRGTSIARTTRGCSLMAGKPCTFRFSKHRNMPRARLVLPAVQVERAAIAEHVEVLVALGVVVQRNLPVYPENPGALGGFVDEVLPPR
ncbi:hypothetical protein GCM10017788_55750 [Amycolatopsis acidiphila]|nr:hypothetical protein GCM10017788_55750 [Amycolatopsis acidiphila]